MIFTIVLASTQCDSLLSACAENATVQLFEAIGADNNPSKRGVSLLSTIHSPVQEPGFKPPIPKVKYQDGLQKRGQELSSLLSLKSDKKQDSLPKSTWPPLTRTNSLDQLTKLKDPKTSPKPAHPALTRQKSAPPSLVDLPPIKAFALREKARSTVSSLKPVSERAIESWKAKQVVLPPSLRGDALAAEKIRRFERANADAHALVRHKARISNAFAQAADAARQANWPQSVKNSKIRQHEIDLGRGSWKARAKADSYASQIERTKLKDSREKDRLIALTAQNQNVDAYLNLYDHERASRERLVELGEKFRDAQRLEQQHLDANRRYAGALDFGHADLGAANPDGSDIVTPYTPSAASSRGGSDTDERLRRVSLSTTSSRS